MDGINQYNAILTREAQEQTHHGSAVFHQVDANDAQKCSKTQLEAQRDQSRRDIRVQRIQRTEQTTSHSHWASEGSVTGGVTHGDAGVISSNRHVVCASGRDQAHSQHQQSQSQQRHSHPQSRPPPTLVLNWGWRGGSNRVTRGPWQIEYYIDTLLSLQCCSSNSHITKHT